MFKAVFEEISDNSIERPLQLPIRTKRFRYLINEYRPKEEDKWVMYCNNEHFKIYDTESKKCIIDAFYCVSEGDCDKDDDIKAVIFKYQYDKEEFAGIIEKSASRFLDELISRAL